VIPVGDSARTRTFPFVNLLIIAANFAVFALELSLGSDLNRNQFLCDWGAIPREITYFFAPSQRPEAVVGACGLTTSNVGIGELARPLTAMFIHAGWLHILGNMLFLWIFGDNIEGALGHFGYLVFFVVCGLAGTAAQILAAPYSTLPMVGASGAIAGVMGAYLVLYPRARVAVVTPFFIFLGALSVPAVLLIGVWFFAQLLSGVATVGYATGGSGGVAWWAHVGGFIAGAVAVGLPRLLSPGPRNRFPS
jgi:membrane associated rhomboid family serine protease